MTPSDLDYIRSVLDANLVTGPVLELGAGYGGSTCRELFASRGIDYFGTDMAAGPGVDYVANFETMTRDSFDRQFQCVLALNVLEHTFEPLKVADNALALVRPGGCLVLLTPAIWPLHEYPVDCYRLLPQWYEVYAKTRGLQVVREHFRFLPGGTIDAFRSGKGEYAFPPPSGSAGKLWRSRLVHRLFRTTGRGMATPIHVAIGAVLRRA